MSNDYQIAIVAWSGRLSELAANLGMDRNVLATQLRKLAGGASPIRGKLTVPVNSPTVIRALRHRVRMVESETDLL